MNINLINIFIYRGDPNTVVYRAFGIFFGIAGALLVVLVLYHVGCWLFDKVKSYWESENES